ncbi:MAG: alpha-E domain-containing protein [Bryobacteraceae bacterium]|nr:alpha-E domain-containing protein [Bryobacteraceae bacterium]
MNHRPLLSRVADSVYWMSRYIERAENVARFIDVNLQLMLEAPAAAQQWRPLIDTSGDSEAFFKRHPVATREAVIGFLTFDAKNPNSILSCLRSARENARSVRDTISSEMWEQANRLFLMMLDEISGSGTRTPHELYRELKLACHLFQGITDSTMSHNEAWHFIRLARMLERADKTTRILDVKYFLLLPRLEDVGTPIDDVQWAAVLKSVSGFEMYRKRYGRIKPNDVAEFLVLDREFPRAVRHCVIGASKSLYAITGSPQDTFGNRAESLLGHLRADLDYTPLRDIIGGGLHEFLDGLQVKMNCVDQAILDTFFALRPAGGPAQTGNAFWQASEQK